jgi:methyl-accepting chemotaxis protein
MDYSSYTAREILEIKGSLRYFLLVVGASALAFVFQIAARVYARAILLPVISSIFCSILAFIIFTRKKNRRASSLLSWVTAFLMINLPIAAKYNYASVMDWRYAAESYHIAAIAVFSLVIIQFLYNRKLFMAMAVYLFVHWAVFLFLASEQGVTMHMLSVVDGKPVHDFILLREIYFMVLMAVISYAAYQNIPIVDEYDSRTTYQMSIIEKQTAARLEMAHDINEKTGELFEQVDMLNGILGDFSQRMQSQASTFEEISATLEELLGSAENISSSAGNQIEENRKMDHIIGEFRNIQQETKTNLDMSLDGITHMLAKTTSGKEKLEDVERYISDIHRQSSGISETMTVITDIADRINLLSLNASIEAARAGEHGRGFAVVAAEIGKLAVRTSESIKEIESVLSANTKTTREGVDVIRSTTGLVKGMIGDIEDSSNTIKTLKESVFVEEKYMSVIIEQTFKNLNLARDIGTGTDEQKLAIESTTKAMEHINETLAEMVRGVNEISRTSQRIFDNARTLVEKAGKAAL